MMVKNFNRQDLDKFINDWTYELLPADINDRITDCIVDFVENDETEIEVEDLIVFHIHELAIRENIASRRSWRIMLSSVAAATVAIFAVTGIYLTVHQPDKPVNENVLVVKNQPVEPHIVKENESVRNNTESIPPTSLKTGNKQQHKKAMAKSTSKTKQVENAMTKEDERSEFILTETLSEINVGIVNMVDNAKECLYLADNYSSSQTNGQIPNINIIEANLIDALNEIRNLNIDLNIKTQE